jgi:hypothetical protein
LSSVVAADVIDRSGKWDVNGPLGPEQGTLSFSTSEGTWMNLDVHPDGNSLLYTTWNDEEGGALMRASWRRSRPGLVRRR